MDTRLKTEKDVAEAKHLTLFGKDLTEIPCFRRSFMCGVCCGVIGGLAFFLVTSKAVLSTHVSFGSLWLGVFGYWIPCRYKYESKQLLLDSIIRKRSDNED